jgi:hypothetical protein
MHRLFSQKPHKFPEIWACFHKNYTAKGEGLRALDHPDVAASLNDLAELYDEQGHYVEALPLVRRTMSNRTATNWAALPVAP